MFRPSAVSRDLRPRAVSAAVLAVVALGANWAGHRPFGALVLAIALVMSWEWARIVRGGEIDRPLIAQWFVVAIAAGLTLSGLAWLAVGIVLVAALAMLGTGASPAQAKLNAAGVAYVGLPAISMIWLRGSDGHGLAAIFFIFAIVWTTDTAAYVCGRLIGGPKLWPALSPGKTWAGTIGGIVFAAVAGVVFASQVHPPAMLGLAVVAVGLSIVSQMGDLAESALKRAFDVKNASDLIPGHGGFMDRMDGVVAAATAAALLAVLRGSPSPGQALLLWS